MFKVTYRIIKDGNKFKVQRKTFFSGWKTQGNWAGKFGTNEWQYDTVEEAENSIFRNSGVEVVKYISG